MPDGTPENKFEIERYEAFWRLYHRFGVIPSGGKGTAYLSPTIQPVTQMDELLRHYKLHRPAVVSLTAGQNTTKVVETVPRGERWTISKMTGNRLTGDNTMARIHIKDASEGTELQLDSQAAASTYLYRPRQPDVLDELDTISVNFPGAGAAASTFNWDIHMYVERAFEPGT